MSKARIEQESVIPKKELRFEFGKNWQQFLSVLDDERIEEAVHSLKSMLEVESLEGKTFLDIGSGSGLFSLAAMRIGASKVFSFDYDLQSVACTRELKQRYFISASNWTIEQGSVLDRNYLEKLGEWDVVYSWGVLHHTGNMWQALANVASLVAAKGTLFISIYNDQGGTSQRWRKVKKGYNHAPDNLKGFIVFGVFLYFLQRWLLARILRCQFRFHTKTKTPSKGSRGMSHWYDLIDWVGGYPFEVAKPEQIFDFYQQRSFELYRLKTCGGSLGCNEFVFRRKDKDFISYSHS